MNRELWNQYRDYVEANSPEGFMTYVQWLEERLIDIRAAAECISIDEDGEDA